MAFAELLVDVRANAAIADLDGAGREGAVVVDQLLMNLEDVHVPALAPSSSIPLLIPLETIVTGGATRG